MQEHAANYSPPQNIVAREHPAGSQAYCPLPLQEGDEGLDWGTIATKGTPRAKRENNKLRAKLLRRTRLVVLITTFKVLLETLTELVAGCRRHVLVATVEVHRGRR